MSNNEFEKVGLYEHNARAYRKVKKAFDSGEKIVGIVHSTGTGKTYIAEELAYDNKEKKTIYLVPSNSIMEHVISTIEDNPNLDMNRDFPNLEFRTYQSLVNMSEEEIEDLNVELLIIDEFHHIGAPIWGDRVNKIIESHPNINVFGMTAYTVRDRGTPFERDMANPETNELFSNKIVSRYDLCDALLDGVLPTQFSYRTAYTVSQNDNDISQLEEKLDKLQEGAEKQKYKVLLNDCKKRITAAKEVKDVVINNIKKDGKIIYFCPPGAVEGVNDVETIMKEVKGWFSEYINDDDMVFYVTTSEMGEDGKANRDAFYYDKTLDGQSAQGKLRIMFAINQYNEGVHAPNVDGVIMGRYTSSDIVYFEQLGRVLSVGGNESPVIIDLTNNFEFIKELENELKGRIKERKEKGDYFPRNLELSDNIFDIKIENENLYEMLRYLKDRLAPASWEEMYNLAKAYYKENHDLEIVATFRTKDGITFDSNGRNLGVWVKTQRDFEQQGILLKERYDLLKLIGMRFENNKFDIIWQEMYNLAKAYYDEYHDLEVPTRFKTKDGIKSDPNGKALGNWVRMQRTAYKDGSMPEDRKKLLDQIGMRFKETKADLQWKQMYKLAKAYYKKNKNLDIPTRFKTKNGVSSNPEGEALGQWIKTQRESEIDGKLSPERKKLLEQIKMRFEIRDYDEEWQEMYNLAKAYYDSNKNLNVSQEFKTKNGKEFDKDGKNLGTWIVTQRRNYQAGKLSEDRKTLLDTIGMRFKAVDFDENWKEMFKLAKAYYDYHKNSEIPVRFSTKNGYEHDESGKKLGKWIVNQRTDKKNNKLSEERTKLLESIDIRFEPKRNVSKVKRYTK